jgi:hypothetical protein
MESRHRRHTPFVVCFVCIVCAWWSAAGQAAGRRAGGTIVRVHVTSGARSIDGSGVLINEVRQKDGTALYFLTSAHLFEDAGPHRVRIKLNAWDTIDVSADDTFLPYSASGDIAVLRAFTNADAYQGLVTVPMTLEAPDAGDVFVVSGLDPGDLPTTVAQHVSFAAAKFLIGDRATGELHDCAGAPALMPEGVFGLVSECAGGLPPVVSLLSASHAFIASHVPGWDAAPTRTMQYQVNNREIAGPLLTVACDEVKTGDIAVPVQVLAHEAIVGATAEFTNPTSLRLGDVTIAASGFEDHAVHLRFTMVGVPPPLVKDPGDVCPQGQALVTIKVTTVQWP